MIVYEQQNMGRKQERREMLRIANADFTQEVHHAASALNIMVNSKHKNTLDAKSREILQNIMSSEGTYDRPLIGSGIRKF